MNEEDNEECKGCFGVGTQVDAHANPPYFYPCPECRPEEYNESS